MLTVYRFNHTRILGVFGSCYTISLLFMLRLIRGWNQTGQKHAGGSDIAKTYLPAHNCLLWTLVLTTYLDIVQRLSRGAMPWASRKLSSAASIGVGITALSFKIAFTKADAPELLQGLQFLDQRPTEATSLVTQARVVFVSMFALAALTCVPEIYQRLSRRREAQGLDLPEPFSIL